MLKRNRVTIILGLLTVWYLLATLPYLEHFPRMEWAQPMIVAPAWKLADQGIYGSDMFATFYEADTRNYDHMPLYGLFLAGAFKLLGLGIWQARLISVLAGLFVIYLTYQLGKTLFDVPMGLLAAIVVACLRISIPNDLDIIRLGYQMNATGIPLLDFARVIRFDVMVPLWVLAASLAFISGMRRKSAWRFLLAGLLTGMALLTHVYGAFILPVFVLLLWWETGWRTLRQSPIYMLMAGFVVAVLPYVIYVLGGLENYRGQSLRHQARFDFFSPRFYWDSLLGEPWRYLSWLGGSFREAVLWPRLGIWLLLIALAITFVLLLRHIRHHSTLATRFLLLSLPILMGLLALLINLKRYQYTALIVPFLALYVAYAGLALWRQGRGGIRWVLVGLFVLMLVEGAIGMWGGWQQAQAATDHKEVVTLVQETISSDARVLGTHSAWFALAQYDLWSVNLAFVRSDPRFGYDPTPSLAEVIAEIAPDFIVMEQRLLQKYEDDRFSDTLPLSDLDNYIQTNCPTVAGFLPSADYGDIAIYQCH